MTNRDIVNYKLYVDLVLLACIYGFSDNRFIQISYTITLALLTIEHIRQAIAFMKQRDT